MPFRNILIIGASTGGLKVLEDIFPRLPILNAATVIIQHITSPMDAAYATSLARVSKMPVSLAKEGEMLEHGKVYLAPGGMHMNLVRNQSIHLYNGEKVNSVCPSIDVSMGSLIQPIGGRLVGVILTGMGCDGAAGISHIKQIGGITIAQDQSTSVIYGMPRVAAETGMIDFILSTDRITDKLTELFG